MVLSMCTWLTLIKFLRPRNTSNMMKRTLGCHFYFGTYIEESRNLVGMTIWPWCEEAKVGGAKLEHLQRGRAHSLCWKFTLYNCCCLLLVIIPFTLYSGSLVREIFSTYLKYNLIKIWICTNFVIQISDLLFMKTYVVRTLQRGVLSYDLLIFN